MKITTDTGVDVTEAVQVIYDQMFMFMDQASGWLDADEAKAIRHLARACGFDAPTFDSDMCTCGHNIIRPRQFERRPIEHPMPACGHEEHRTPSHWITVETDPGESVKCTCQGFEWVGDDAS